MFGYNRMLLFANGSGKLSLLRYLVSISIIILQMFDSPVVKVFIDIFFNLSGQQCLELKFQFFFSNEK